MLAIPIVAYHFGEVALLAAIVHYARTWPRIARPANADVSTPDQRHAESAAV